MTGFGYNINGFGAPGKQPGPPGQQAYTSSGTYSWTCPDGVESVCVVAVGGGGSGNSGKGGGGLGWKNNISVIPGQSYTVRVGARGSSNSSGSNGGDSYFISNTTVKGGGGETSYPSLGGDYVGDGGGRGGGASGLGGGGAGGYSGSGGKQQGTSYDGSWGAAGSQPDNNVPSGGGGGAGGYWGAGGGVGILGEGDSGDVPTAHWQQGEAGSGGSGVTYGGGGAYSGYGGGGAVRIIWGINRAFPSTRTADE